MSQWLEVTGSKLSPLAMSGPTVAALLAGLAAISAGRPLLQGRAAEQGSGPGDLTPSSGAATCPAWHDMTSAIGSVGAGLSSGDTWTLEACHSEQRWAYGLAERFTAEGEKVPKEFTAVVAFLDDNGTWHVECRASNPNGFNALLARAPESGFR